MRTAVKNKAKLLAFQVLGSSPLTARQLRRSQALNRLTILNFHRVAPDDRSAYAPLDPSLFEEAVRFCRKHFAIHTFGDLADYKPGSAQPPAIISFDDGYRDFVDVVVPILTRLRVRVNLNVIPESVRTGLPPLNVLAQDFIGKAPGDLLSTLVIPGFGSIDPSRPRVETGMRVSNFIKNKSMADQTRIRETLAPQFDRFIEFEPTRMMTLADVQRVSTDHELGAHSWEHANLSEESDEYVATDARKCRDFFAREVGRPTSIYALPNGAGGQREVRILREAGFDHILFTGEGYSGPGEVLHRRFSMAGSSKAEIRARSAGFAKRTAKGSECPTI